MARFLLRLLVIVLVVAAALSADAMPGDRSVRLPVTVTTGSETASVVVAPGDHLWKISSSRLSDDLGREASDAEIWPYWRSVIDANTDRLRSGDPDLIYPGEVIQLPDV